jgi:hypothetical protein
MASDQSYPGLGQIRDQATQQALRLLWDRLYSLQGRTNDERPRTQILDLGGKRISNVGAATTDTDALTKVIAEALYGPRQLRGQLMAGGDYPLDVGNLPGVLAQSRRRRRAKSSPGKDPSTTST